MSEKALNVKLTCPACGSVCHCDTFDLARNRYVVCPFCRIEFCCNAPRLHSTIQYRKPVSSKV